MNGYAEMVGYGIRIKAPYFKHFFLQKLKNPVFNGFIRRKQGSFLYVSVLMMRYGAIHQSKFGFDRESSEQYNYALRITNYALKSP